MSQVKANNAFVSWEQAVLWLREQPDQQELVRACFYDDPLTDAALRYEACEEWQATCRLLPSEPGYVLDLGAGRGINSFALARMGWKVDALEPDPSYIVGRGAIQQLAAQSKLPIRPLNGFAENIPSEDNRYDLVYGRQVMHHAQNFRKMCSEVTRVLKRSGMFIVTREHVISQREDLSAFLANHPLHSLYGGENAFLLREYLVAIKGAGLTIESVFGPYDTPINYFPMTTEEWQKQIWTALAKRIGTWTTRFLMPTSTPWSNIIYRLFSSYKSRHSRIPGRLYTFIARKP